MTRRIEKRVFITLSDVLENGKEIVNVKFDFSRNVPFSEMSYAELIGVMTKEYVVELIKEDRE